MCAKPRSSRLACNIAGARPVMRVIAYTITFFRAYPYSLFLVCTCCSIQLLPGRCSWPQLVPNLARSRLACNIAGARPGMRVIVRAQEIEPFFPPFFVSCFSSFCARCSTRLSPGRSAPDNQCVPNLVLRDWLAILPGLDLE